MGCKYKTVASADNKGRGKKEIYHTSGPPRFMMHLKVLAQDWVLNNIAHKMQQILYTFKMHIIQFIYTHPSLYTHTPPLKKKKKKPNIYSTIAHQAIRERSRGDFSQIQSQLSLCTQSHAKDYIQNELNTKIIYIHLKYYMSCLTSLLSIKNQVLSPLYYCPYTEATYERRKDFSHFWIWVSGLHMISTSASKIKLSLE